MSIDFNKVKEIPIVNVVGKYGVQLRFRGEWGAGICPLPSHKQGEKEKTFSVSTSKNYWKCFSASCNEQAGCKGGDTINFVALMDGSTQLTAAKKLADWFHVGETTAPATRQTKTPEHIVQGSKPTNLQKTNSDNSTSQVGVKYTEKVRQWFDEMFPRREGESDADYPKRILRAITTELIKNYQAGKAGRVL
jgi:DNA primase